MNCTGEKPKRTWRSPDHRALVSFGVIVVILVACTGRADRPGAPGAGGTAMPMTGTQSPSNSLQTESSSLSTPAPEERVTLHGWLSIVWNDSAHYFLTDDQGQTVEILLDERLTLPFGGPLSLDRARVIIVAAASDEVTSALQVLSITLETDE